ncbi:hypothetical protein [Pseudidiomarina salilacus]|uniref:hypothetical protein n=1 Tax=Pseudidiomarina salilacus TaxID=3384452 RepID=UPI003984FF21
MIGSLKESPEKFFATLEKHDRLISYNLNLLILFGMCFLLWVDSLTGAMTFYGVGIGSVSVLYKLVILMLVMANIASTKPKVIAAFLLVIIVLMIGPSQSLLTHGETGFYFADFALLFKIITPFIAFTYFYLLHKTYPELTATWLPRILFVNFAAVFTNLTLGLLGFGFPSYSGVEGQPGIGVNGFYVAGNELSACFALLFGFVLHYVWNHHSKKMYVVMAIITFAFGTAIATKTAMLASLLLIFALPLFNERENIFKFTRLKALVFIPFFIIASVLVIYIANFLTAIGLYDKITWVLQEKGLLTLILSGRDIKSAIIFDHFFRHMDQLDYLWGIGSSGIKHFEYPYYSIEIDPFDVFVWFGAVGLTYIFIALVTMNYVAFRQLRSRRPYPPLIVVVNVLLLVLSFVSGHIWTSGMLGILWGALNAMAFIAPMDQNRRLSRSIKS